MSNISTKPYLLRALYEWCTDNGYTPHIAVYVDQRTRVPKAFVKNDEIILNISMQATQQLQMGNDWIEFSARFSGRSHKVEVPVGNVLAIYALENGQGMAFPVEPKNLDEDLPGGSVTSEPDTEEKLPKDVSPQSKQQEKQNKAKRGHLTVIK